MQCHYCAGSFVWKWGEFNRKLYKKGDLFIRSTYDSLRKLGEQENLAFELSYLFNAKGPKVLHAVGGLLDMRLRQKYIPGM